MKKLISYSLILIGLVSTTAFANDISGTATANNTHKNGGENWAVFHEVVNTYFTSTGKFLTLSENEKAEFYAAAEAIKNHLAASERPGSETILAKVNLSEAVFRFIWENKVEFQDADLSIVPPAFI